MIVGGAVPRHCAVLLERSGSVTASLLWLHLLDKDHRKPASEMPGADVEQNFPVRAEDEAKALASMSSLKRRQECWKTASVAGATFSSSTEMGPRFMTLDRLKKHIRWAKKTCFGVCIQQTVNTFWKPFHCLQHYRMFEAFHQNNVFVSHFFGHRSVRSPDLQMIWTLEKETIITYNN